MPPFEELTLLIYGAPKGGKTTFASGKSATVAFNPSAVFLATEPGHDFIRNSVARIYDQGMIDYNAANPDKQVANNWQLFHRSVANLYQQKKAGKLKARTAVIDIVDNLYIYCYDAVCKQLGLKEPSGNDWNLIRTEWETWLKRLLSCIDVVFLTHASEETYEVETDGIKQKFQRTIPTFKGKSKAQFIDGMVNAIGYVTKSHDGKRVITFKPSNEQSAGDRTGILEALGEMPNDWDHVRNAYAAKAKELGLQVVSKHA